MKPFRFCLLWVIFAGPIARAQELPTSLDALPPSSGMPDLFSFDDGTLVNDLDDWQRRREELIAPLLFYQYGRMPPRPDQVTATVDQEQPHDSGLGTESWLTLIIDSVKQLKMRIVVYAPSTPGPHPVIIEEEGSLGGSKHAALFLGKNYLFVEYARHDLDPDKRDVIGPAQRAYPAYDWATLAVWAWGGQRVVDYLETRDDVDLKRVAITGHSRGGKQALLAAALDPRITLAVPNGSGAGGAGASRVLGPGAESIGMNDKPHWYHERIQVFGEHEAHLPFDQHYLKALVAPRGLYCIESTDDLFANPVGTFASSAAAMPVFELHGVPQRNAITFRRGGHTFSTADWQSLLDFAELTFFARRPEDGRAFWQRPADVTPQANRGGEPGFVLVGDPGNRADVDYPRVGSFGAVAEPFEIGRYKVSNAEYSEFLNSVANRSDHHQLYHPSMKIARHGREGEYRYRADPASRDSAVTFVSWHDALRYCNWLHGGDSESGAYPFSGTTIVGKRNQAANYFLPSEDEWYKACYFDPETDQYRLHPLRDAHREHADQIPVTKSKYGMLETADPIWEWTDSMVGSLFRGLRSDSWFQGNNRQAQGRFYINPDLELGNVGFRVGRRVGG